MGGLNRRQWMRGAVFISAKLGGGEVANLLFEGSGGWGRRKREKGALSFEKVRSGVRIKLKPGTTTKKVFMQRRPGTLGRTFWA